MRNNSQDETIVRNYLQKYRFLIAGYELVKAQKHRRFRFAREFYAAYDTGRRSFRKYYNRYKQSGEEKDLLPQKRGPEWKTRRPSLDVTAAVCALRRQGMNRYEIVHVLKPRLGDWTPSPSGVYTILRREGLNRMTKPMNEAKQVAESTLTAIMGRMAAYTGQDVTWEQALNSQESLLPAKLEMGDLSVPSVAMPGVTKLT